VLICTAALISPIWIGPILPLPDFAAHAATADVWARFDEVEFFREMFVLRTELIPNTLSSRFADLVEPSVPTTTALRLYLSIAIAATVAGIVAVAHAFKRSVWLVFLLFPFVWTTAVHAGAVDVAAVLPFGLASVALAKKTADTGHGGWAAGMALTAIAAFFMHPSGAPLCVSSATLVLVIFARQSSTRWQALALIPSAGLWVYWVAQSEVALSNLGYRDPLVRLEYLFSQGIAVSWFSAGGTMLFGLALVFAGWLRISSSTDEESDRLLWLYLGLCGVFMLLPSSIHQVDIAFPVGFVLLVAIALYPRVSKDHQATPYLVGAAVVISVAVGVYLASQSGAVQQRHLSPLGELAEDIEPGSHIDCYALESDDTAFHGAIRRRFCPGYLQLASSGFGGSHVFEQRLNPVGFAGTFTYKPIEDFGLDDIGHVQRWDYLVTDGKRPRPPRKLSSLVETARGIGANATEWHLYRVTSFERDWTTHRVSQADGGTPYTWSCPSGYALRGYKGKRTKAGVLSTLKPICREISPLTPEPFVQNSKPVRPPKLGGDELQGPRLGQRTPDTREFRTLCPTSEFVVGLEGVRRDLVRDIAVRCSRVETTTDRMTGETRFTWIPSESFVVGELPDEGTRFSYTCRPDSVVTGAVGRSGYYVDAVGIGCERADTLAEMP
jgi:hypothetical protein